MAVAQMARCLQTWCGWSGLAEQADGPRCPTCAGDVTVWTLDFTRERHAWRRQVDQAWAQAARQIDDRRGPPGATRPRPG
jgi:hypothetical protein